MIKSILFTLITLLASAEIINVSNNVTFDQTPVFGIKTAESAFVSDIPFLKSQKFDEPWRVKVIQVCGRDTGSYNAFEGINLVLGNGIDTRFVMKSLGSQLNCEKWILPTGHYFALIQLGYDQGGPTYFRA